MQRKDRPGFSRIRSITGNITDITAVKGSTFNQHWVRSKVAHFQNHLVELNLNERICQHQLHDYTSFSLVPRPPLAAFFAAMKIFFSMAARKAARGSLGTRLYQFMSWNVAISDKTGRNFELITSPTDYTIVYRGPKFTT